jgi:hypothetical protein
LRKGRVCRFGKTSKVVSEYLAYLDGGAETDDGTTGSSPADTPYLPEVMIEDVRLLDEEGRTLERVKQFQTVIIQVKTRRTGPPLKGHLAVGLGQPDGQQIFETTTKISGLGPVEFAGEQVTELVFPSIPILGGHYQARAKVGDEHALRAIDELKSAPFLIESDHPELGIMWMQHYWRPPEAAEVPD